MEHGSVMFIEFKNNFIGLTIFKDKYFIIFRDFFDTFSLEITKSFIYKFEVTLCVTSMNIPLQKYDLILERGVELKIENNLTKNNNYFIEGCQLSLVALNNLSSFLNKNCEHYNSINNKIVESKEKFQKESFIKIGKFGEYDLFLFENSNFLYYGGSSILSLNLVTNDTHPNKFIKTEKGNSLFSRIDFCATKNGKERLKRWMFFPLLNIKKINERRSVIDFILENNLIFHFKALLKKLTNQEESYTKKYFISLRENYKIFKQINYLMKNNFCLEEKENLTFLEMIDETSSFIFKEDLSSLEKDFSFISISNELRNLKNIYKNLPNYLNEIGKKVFNEYKIEGSIIYFPQIGYLIETKSEIELQKIFELNENNYYKNEFMINLDEEFGDVKNKINDLEIELMYQFNKKYSSYFEEIKDYLAEIDALNSLAIFAEKNSLTKAEINLKGNFFIKNLRSIFFEEKNNFDFTFEKSVILTGMNGSGKTHFMKTLAHCIILNQMGAYLPCENSTLPIFDKILIKFSNNKLTSTFLNDLQQINEIIRFSNDSSLILIDEFGKSTSFYDGLSILLSLLKNLKNPFKIITTHMQEHFFDQKDDTLQLKEKFSFLNNYKFIKTISTEIFSIKDGVFIPENESELINSFSFDEKFMNLFLSLKNGNKKDFFKKINDENEEATKIINEFISNK